MNQISYGGFDFVIFYEGDGTGAYQRLQGIHTRQGFYSECISWTRNPRLIPSLITAGQRGRGQPSSEGEFPWQHSQREAFWKIHVGILDRQHLDQ